jgi:hypothetical protein
MYEEMGRDEKCMKRWVGTKKYEELGRDKKCMKSWVGMINV